MRLTASLTAALAVVVLASCTTSSSTEAPAQMTTASDPYLWLEDIEGDRALAWVREQNERSLGQLESDPRYAQLLADATAIANSRDRLPLGDIREGYLYNFWQDETHVRGIWRRSPIDAYARGEPQWDTLLDIDALARGENENWVYKGVDCLEGHDRCMVQLSVGGRDASTFREFDLRTRQFVEDGFVVPAAKGSTTWLDADTLLVGTDWGAGTLTESGYPFVMKRWRRGTPLASAEEVLRGAPSDVGVYGGLLEDVDNRRVPVVVEADTFFESTKWRLDTAEPQRINLPAKSTLIGLYRGYLLFTLEEA